MTSLYIHIPFCEQKCFYCSFAVTIGQEHKIDTYLDCLAREAQRYKGTAIETIYWGGGTPSSLNVDQCRRLFDMIHQNFSFSKEIEWTLEANPESVDERNAKTWKQNGVNRVSLGVQSLDDRYLAYLGRKHDLQAVYKAFEILRNCGFGNINCDLIFSLPQQTPDELDNDVRNIAKLGSEHLSLYALTIEENTRFYTKDVQLSDQERQSEDYSLVLELLKQSGFQQYEISNFAKVGKESRHNLNYWQGGDYIGLGLSAHSHNQGHRYWNCSNFQTYLAKVSSGELSREGQEYLSPENRLIESLVFGLRMNTGVNIKVLEEKFAVILDEQRRIILNGLIEKGLCETFSGNLRVTAQGRLVLDEISLRLI